MKKEFLKKASMIMAIIILFTAFSVLTFAENMSDENLSYEDYFSEEHMYEDLTLVVNSGYFFDIDENGFLYRYPNDKKKSDTLYKETIYEDGSVIDYTIVRDRLLFIVDGRKIYKSYLDGTSAEMIFEAPNTINENMSDIFADDFLIWFRAGDDIYRLYVENNILDKIYANSNIISYRPISNYSIEYSIYSEEWNEYLLEGGNSECDVDFQKILNYKYFIETGETIEYVNDEILGYNFPSNSAEEALLPFDISHYGSYSSNINGKSIPAPKYPIGSYIGEYSNAPCGHHTTTNNDDCYPDGSCGCKVLGYSSSLGTGIQCNGFAKEIYGYLFLKNKGTYTSFANTNSSTKAGSVLSNLHPGAYIRTNTGHSLILIKAFGSYADFYHANYEEACKVSITRFDYSDFSSKYRSIEIYDGCHYFVYSSGKTVCAYCGIEGDTGIITSNEATE